MKKGDYIAFAVYYIIVLIVLYFLFIMISYKIDFIRCSASQQFVPVDENLILEKCNVTYEEWNKINIDIVEKGGTDLFCEEVFLQPSRGGRGGCGPPIATQIIFFVIYNIIFFIIFFKYKKKHTDII